MLQSSRLDPGDIRSAVGEFRGHLPPPDLPAFLLPSTGVLLLDLVGPDHHAVVVVGEDHDGFALQVGLEDPLAGP